MTFDDRHRIVTRSTNFEKKTRSPAAAAAASVACERAMPLPTTIRAVSCDPPLCDPVLVIGTFLIVRLPLLHSLSLSPLQVKSIGA